MSDLLLVIDMQEGFYHPIIEPIVPVIQRIVTQFNGEVVFTQFVNKPSTQFYKQLDWNRFSNSDDQAIIDDLAPLAKQVSKHASYTCLNTEIQSIIKEGLVTRVFICGVFTDVCITKTAMDCFDAGLETFVVSDAVATLHGRAINEATLKSLSYIIGDEHLLTQAQLRKVLALK